MNDDDIPPIDIPSLLEALRLAEAEASRAASEADYFRKAYAAAKEAVPVQRLCIDCYVEPFRMDDGVLRCWRCGREDPKSWLDLAEHYRACMP